MSCHPEPVAVLSAGSAGHRRGRVALAALSALLAAAFAGVTAGALEPPDIAGALTGLSGALGAWAYPLVGGLAFLETGAFVGLVVPGETAVVLGGVVAARGDVDLAPMLALVWLAAAFGDLASFALGRRLGRSFVLAHGSRFAISPPRLARVESFFARHGPRAIVFGRWIGVVRALLPFAAGSSGMPLRAFLPWSLIGTAAWAATFILVGFAFQTSFATVTDALAHGALGVAAIALAVVAWRARRSRQQII